MYIPSYSDITSQDLSDAWISEKDAAISSINEVQERFTYKLPEVGFKAELTIHFAGTLTGNTIGYYQARWETEGKATHYSLTQFEATAARRAFPCWDEPLLKAKFTVTLISRVGTVNLSNMSALYEEPVEEGIDTCAELKDILASTRNEEREITKFDTSPPMSSYVVVFASEPFVFIESLVTMHLSGRTIPLIYSNLTSPAFPATPGLIRQTQFALDVKAAALTLYERLFDVEYPLHKFDTLVVSELNSRGSPPSNFQRASDFDPAAMENWGLIIGCLSSMLIDPDLSDLLAMKEVASVQSHEVPYMWYTVVPLTYTFCKGSVISQLWNSGPMFILMKAGRLEDFVRVHPEWLIGTEFINKNLGRALRLDTKLSSRPIEVDSSDANDINRASSTDSVCLWVIISGGLIMHIMTVKFLKGVSIYLKKNSLQTSVTRDLWDGISAATGLDISELMDAWITKIGFPVVTVTEDTEGITVCQDRFLETVPVSREDTVQINARNGSREKETPSRRVEHLEVRKGGLPSALPSAFLRPGDEAAPPPPTSPPPLSTLYSLYNIYQARRTSPENKIEITSEGLD
ncbi:hypothetical protein CVT25_011466 [Psilocybe cyanescens]|uniref:Uncharacterized protein n=1 Tax=Psilocybe cyanescens TaxID=93625 RepID=A0A409XA93_PSICY|nr:hypothetical protein CVT25_011466 [Psilocybe cyanescens]